MDGLATLRALKEMSPEIAVVRVSGHATAEKAMEAIGMGAFDCLPKPFELDELGALIKWTLECGRQAEGAIDKRPKRG